MSEKNETKKERTPLLWLFVTLFCVGLLFKMLHWPFASLIAILAVFSCIVSGVYFTVKALVKKSPKKQLVKSLQTFAVGGFLAYVLFRIQFWALANQVMFMALGIMVAYAIVSLSWKSTLKTPVFLVVVMALILGQLRVTLGHALFKAINMNEVFNSSFSPGTHDRYSWFLNLGDEKELALKANDDAMKAVEYERGKSDFYSADLDKWESLITDHRYIIENNRSLDLWVFNIYED